MKTATLRLLLLTLLLSAAGCDVDPFGNDDDDDGGFPTDPITLDVLGHGTVTERFTAEVAVDGDWAYTSTWSQRQAAGNVIKIWNVTGATPVLVDSIVVANASTLGDVQISEDGALLVVATEGLNSGSMVVYDRSDPARPTQLSRHSTSSTQSGVHTLKLDRVGGTLYAFLSITRPGDVVVVDLSDPRDPVEVLVRSMGGPFVHDVFLRDGLLFTAGWDGGMSIWDIGGGNRGGAPDDPVLISNIQTVGGNVHNMWWFHDPDGGEERYVFVGEEAPPFSVGSRSAGDIHVVDISDIENPREVAFYTVAGAGTHNFTMDEASGVLYAAYYNGGVRVLDVRGDLSSCAAEARDGLGRCDLGLMGREVATGLTDVPQVSVWGVARVGSELYASDMSSGLFKLDISPLQR
jgi:hypothetical protein